MFEAAQIPPYLVGYSIVIAILPLSDKGIVMITVARSLHRNSNTTPRRILLCMFSLSLLEPEALSTSTPVLFTQSSCVLANV
jgi:hypothetical protein